MKMAWIIEKQDNEFRIYEGETLVTIVYDNEEHANLIAAAPDMLKVLNMVNYITGYHEIEKVLWKVKGVTINEKAPQAVKSEVSL